MDDLTGSTPIDLAIMAVALVLSFFAGIAWLRVIWGIAREMERASDESYREMIRNEVRAELRASGPDRESAERSTDRPGA